MKASRFWMAVAATAALAAARTASADDAPAPTFSKDIMPILQESCQGCHRPGEATPMALMDYKSTRPWVKSMKKVISDKTMPPWHADPRYGTFSNDRRLPEEKIALIQRWIDAGAPEGNAADLPAPRKFVEGWNIGQPDLILTVAKPVNVQATGIVDYKDISLPPFPTDRWVEQLEIRPSNRNVAHHINVFRVLPSGGDGKEPEEVDQGQGNGKTRKEFVTGWVPGGITTDYPEGTAVFWPKGTVIHLQAHYVTTGKEESDQTSVGFIFARKPVDKEIHNFLISNYGFAIPPNDGNYESKASWRVPSKDSVTVIGTMVHMHLRGKDYTYKAKYPDGHEEILMAVPKYDFNWQMGYHFKDMPKLPAKTVVEGIAHMDNSKDNPFNPDPNATVKYGPQTTDEMIMGFIFYTMDSEHLADNRGKENLGSLPAQVGQGEATTRAAGAGL